MPRDHVIVVIIHSYLHFLCRRFLGNIFCTKNEVLLITFFWWKVVIKLNIYSNTHQI